ncbi:unnamed protein product [Rhizoctonia solani]|uniref:Uncharacterized protein n=1 Tax=Rhizoctonia solani TaxID=456999 RepID=A0A8H3C7Q9_9AGAM|nr:unnamed protein product [Rhizoctonia solani]
MTTPFRGPSLPPTIDRNALAAAVALASSALAGAAEALAEAAQAMSDASHPGSHVPSGVPSGPISRTRPSDMAGEKLMGIKVEGTHSYAPNQADHSRNVDKQTNPEIDERTGVTLDMDAPTPIHAIPSDLNPWNDTEVINQDKISTFLSLEYESAKADSWNETETNNQTWQGQANHGGAQTLLSLLAPIDISNVLALTNQSTPTNSEQGIFFTAPRTIPSDSHSEFHPAPISSPEPSQTTGIPPNRNFIFLTEPADAISFVAYMAQSLSKILCVTPDEATARSSSNEASDHDEPLKVLLTNVKIIYQLEKLKLVTIYRVYATGLVKATRQKLQSCTDPVPPIVVFMPGSVLSKAPNKNLGVDCVLHWGPPPDAQEYTAQMLSLSPPPRISCVMVIGTREFNESAYGVSPYPDSVLDAFSKYSVELRARPPHQTPRQPVPSRPHPHASLLHNPSMLMKSYPTIPPGRNYIQLNQASDAFAFIAYMALQAKRIVCLAPNQFTNTCAELLKSLTLASIHRITTVHDFKRVSATMGSNFISDLCNILVVSPDLLDLVSFEGIHSDCILHWNQPPNANLFIDKALASLSHTARVCIMMLGEQYFNGLAYGVVPYANTVIDTYVNPQSPFQILRQLSSQLLSGSRQSTRMRLQNPHLQTGILPPKSLGSPASLAPPYQDQTPSTYFPPGHYYILLDETKDIDIIPLIIFITMNSKKVLCRIPGDRSPHHYQNFMRNANLNAIVPTSADHPSEKIATDQLKSTQRGILLRNNATTWHVYWSKSLVDSLIFCEVPIRALKKHYSNCSNKVTHSYLILSKAEYSTIPANQVMNQLIKQHPYIKASEYTRPGSPLYDLRQEFAHRLS